MKKILLSILLTVLFFCAAAPAYEDFSVNVPSNWTLTGNEKSKKLYNDGNEHYMWKGPVNSVFGPGFAALLITATKKDSLGPDIRTLKDFSEYLLKERLPQRAAVLQNIRIEKNGREAFEFTIRYKSLLGYGSYGAPSSFRKVSWLVIEQNGRYFDIRYTAEEADFDKYLPVYEEAKNSFRAK